MSAPMSAVFLDVRGQLKIGDFGLAKFDSGTDAGDGIRPQWAVRPGGATPSEPTGEVGTALYIAPEIISGLPHDSKARARSANVPPVGGQLCPCRCEGAVS